MTANKNVNHVATQQVAGGQVWNALVYGADGCQKFWERGDTSHKQDSDEHPAHPRTHGDHIAIFCQLVRSQDNHYCTDEELNPDHLSLIL